MPAPWRAETGDGLRRLAGGLRFAGVSRLAVLAWRNGATVDGETLGAVAAGVAGGTTFAESDDRRAAGGAGRRGWTPRSAASRPTIPGSGRAGCTSGREVPGTSGRRRTPGSGGPSETDVSHASGPGALPASLAGLRPVWHGACFVTRHALRPPAPTPPLLRPVRFVRAGARRLCRAAPGRRRGPRRRGRRVRPRDGRRSGGHRPHVLPRRGPVLAEGERPHGGGAVSLRRLLHGPGLAPHAPDRGRAGLPAAGHLRPHRRHPPRRARRGGQPVPAARGRLGHAAGGQLARPRGQQHVALRGAAVPAQVLGGPLRDSTRGQPGSQQPRVRPRRRRGQLRLQAVRTALAGADLSWYCRDTNGGRLSGCGDPVHFTSRRGLDLRGDGREGLPAPVEPQQRRRSHRRGRRLGPDATAARMARAPIAGFAQVASCAGGVGGGAAGGGDLTGPAANACGRAHRRPAGARATRSPAASMGGWSARTAPPSRGASVAWTRPAPSACARTTARHPRCPIAAPADPCADMPPRGPLRGRGRLLVRWRPTPPARLLRLEPGLRLRRHHARLLLHRQLRAAVVGPPPAATAAVAPPPRPFPSIPATWPTATARRLPCRTTVRPTRTAPAGESISRCVSRLSHSGQQLHRLPLPRRRRPWYITSFGGGATTRPRPAAAAGRTGAGTTPPTPSVSGAARASRSGTTAPVSSSRSPTSAPTCVSRRPRAAPSGT